MSRKTEISNLFIFAAIALSLLPFLIFFNAILTRLVEKFTLYRWIQETIVPIQAHLVAVVVKPFIAQVIAYPTGVSVNGIFLGITWNCLGWQSMLLFFISLFVALKSSSFSFVSKVETVVLGLFGIFWVNILRMSLTVILAAYSLPIYKIVFHDYLAAVTTIIFLFFFWWFSYSYVLEDRQAQDEQGVIND